MTTPQPILDLEDAPQLIQTETGPALLGSRCSSCGTGAFPARDVCPGCTRPAPSRASLGRSGILYAWTTVHVSSTRQAPYDLGYVDLTDPEGTGVRVLAPLVGTQWAVSQRVTVGEDENSPRGWAFHGGTA